MSGVNSTLHRVHGHRVHAHTTYVQQLSCIPDHKFAEHNSGYLELLVVLNTPREAERPDAHNVHGR